MKKIVLLVVFLASLVKALTTYEAVSVGSTWVAIDPTVGGNSYMNIQNLSNIPMQYTTDNTVVNPPEFVYREVRVGIDTTIYVRTTETNRTGYLAIERY